MPAGSRDRPMSDIINLNKARKRRARDAADKQAIVNRVRFGRSKAQKQREDAEAAEAKRRMDALRREPPGTG